MVVYQLSCSFFGRNILTVQRTFCQTNKSRGLHGELLSCMLRCLQYLCAYLGYVVGFLLGGGCSRGGGNWGTLRIPRESWGTLGRIRRITTPPQRILLLLTQYYPPLGIWSSFRSRSKSPSHRWWLVHFQSRLQVADNFDMDVNMESIENLPEFYFCCYHK